MNKKHITLNHLLAFIVPAITVLIAFIMSGFAPFGDLNIFTFEGLYEYIPYFNELYDKVHGGESLVYSIREGMGYNFTSIWTFYMSDPINLIALIFPKSAMFAVLNFIYLIKIGISGLTFSMLITYFQKKKDNTDLTLKPAMFGIMYALSGYMLGQGLNITWLSAVCLFPLVIMGLHKIIDDAKPAVFVITYALTFITNMYMGIVVSVFIFFYFITREFNNIRHFFKSLALVLSMVFLAVGCSMITIMPSVNSTFYGDLINIIFPFRGFIASIFEPFKMMMAGSLPSTVSADAYGINIYSGSLIVLLLICYILNKGINKTVKLKNLALLALLFISTIIVTTNYIFNGLYDVTDNSVNFGFAIVFFLLLLGYETLDKLSHISAIKLSISAGIVFVLIILTMVFATSYASMTPFITTLELVLLYFVLILLNKKGNVTELGFTIAIFIIAMGEMSFVFVKTMNTMADETQKYEYTELYAIEETKDYIKELEPGSRILPYYGAETNSTPLTNMLEGYDYIICYGEDYVVDSMLEHIGNYGNVQIYKNPYNVDMGVLTNDYIKSWSYNTEYPYKALNALAENAFPNYHGAPLFVPIQGELGFNIEEIVDKETRRISYDYSIKAPIDCDLYMNFYDVVHIGQVKAGDTVSYVYTFTAEQIRDFRLTMTYTNFDHDAYLDLYNSLDTVSVDKSSESSYTSTVSADSDRVFLTNILYEKGWKATVDGKEVDVFAVSGKYAAIDVPAGTHTIKFTFEPHYYYMGIIISVIFILITVAVLIPSVTAIINKLYKKIATAKFPNRIVDFVYDNRTYFYFIFISSAIILFVHLLKGCKPFGSYMPMGNDAYAQVLPYVQNIMNQVRHFELGTVNWDMGLNLDNILVFLSGGSFPINFLMLLFPETMMVEAFVFTYYVKLVLMGMFFMYYLNHRTSGKQVSKHGKLIVILGFAYSFNAFIISYFNNITFLDMGLIIPLVILGLEKLVTHKDNRLYVIALTVSMIFNVYYTFLLCMFLVLYFLVLDFDNFRDFMQKGIRFALNSLLSAGLAALSLVPFYISTTLCAYSNTDAFPGFSFDSHLLYEIQRLLPFSIPVTVDMTSWHANLYCGLLTIIFISLYALNKKISLSVRIRKIFVVVLLFVAFGNELLNFIFHGFHVQTGVPNRFAVYWIFLILTMLADTFYHFEEYSKKVLLLAPAITGGVLVTVSAITKDSPRTNFQFYVTVVMVAIYVLLIVLYCVKKLTAQKAKSLLASALCFELLASGGLNFFQIGSCEMDQYVEDIVAIEEISETLPLTDNMAHNEYINGSVADFGLLAEINQISAFTSVLTVYQSALYTNLGVYSVANYSKYNSGNVLFDMLVNVRYHIHSNYEEYVAQKYDTALKYDHLTIAENPYYISHGIFMDTPAESFDLTEAVGESIFHYHNYIATELSGCDPLYDIIAVPEKSTDGTEQPIYHEIDESNRELLDNDKFHDDLPIDFTIYIKTDHDSACYVSINGATSYLDITPTGEYSEITLAAPKHVYKNFVKDNDLYLGFVNEDAVKQLHDSLSSHTAYNIEYDGFGIEYDIDAPRDGYVMSAISYHPGWKAYVNGVETDIDLFLGGAIYLPVSEGTNHIELKYSCPGFLPGCIISFASLIIFIASIVIYKKKNKEELLIETDTPVEE